MRVVKHDNRVYGKYKSSQDKDHRVNYGQGFPYDVIIFRLCRDSQPHVKSTVFLLILCLIQVFIFPQDQDSIEYADSKEEDYNADGENCTQSI